MSHMLAFLGLFFLVLSVVCVFQVLRARQRINAMVTTESVSSRELRELHQSALSTAGADAFRRHVDVAGTARPHPSGSLTSQLGRTECVWFRTRITRQYEIRRKASSSAEYGGDRVTRKSEVVSDAISATPFLVEDASGSVVVLPAQHIVDHAPKTMDHFEAYQAHRADQQPGHHNPSGVRTALDFLDPSTEHTLGHQQEEWVVRADAQFYVRGEARDDERGELVIGPPSDGSPFLMTARSQEELMSVERGKRDVFAIMAVGACVLGLLALGGHWLLNG
ncbi:GIDE domain-containing protein [Streptomyces sp. NPDC048650]|uniref:GIDE domain-containing protein n=1 Tax=unclassified Streptomyces TaxID=2593676 RepID=UPI00371E62D1